MAGKADDLSFESFYEGQFQTVYDLAWAFSGNSDTALDATQEAFARAFARWSRLIEDGEPVGWVVTTALNLCKRSFRRQRREATVERVTSSPESAPSGDRVDLVNALRELPRRRRMAAVLFYLGDLPIAEVAARMNLSEGAVKAHLHIARTHLHGFLQGEA